MPILLDNKIKRMGMVNKLLRLSTLRMLLKMPHRKTWMTRQRIPCWRRSRTTIPLWSRSRNRNLRLTQLLSMLLRRQWPQSRRCTQTMR